MSGNLLVGVMVAIVLVAIVTAVVAVRAVLVTGQACRCDCDALPSQVSVVIESPHVNVLPPPLLLAPPCDSLPVVPACPSCGPGCQCRGHRCSGLCRCNEPTIAGPETYSPAEPAEDP